MCRIILAVSLAVLCLILWPEPARGEGMVSPTWMMADNQHEQHDIARPCDAGNWLWDLLMDRLTVSLGLADQNIWPMVACEQWIGTAERGCRNVSGADRPRQNGAF
jgi:hypothetical protein